MEFKYSALTSAIRLGLPLHDIEYLHSLGAIVNPFFIQREYFPIQAATLCLPKDINMNKFREKLKTFLLESSSVKYAPIKGNEKCLELNFAEMSYEDVVTFYSMLPSHFSDCLKTITSKNIAKNESGIRKISKGEERRFNLIPKKEFLKHLLLLSPDENIFLILEELLSSQSFREFLPETLDQMEYWIETFYKQPPSYWKDQIIKLLFEFSSTLEKFLDLDSLFKILFYPGQPIPSKELILFAIEKKIDLLDTDLLYMVCKADYLDFGLFKKVVDYQMKLYKLCNQTVLATKNPINRGHNLVNLSGNDKPVMETCLHSLCRNPKATLEMFELIVDYGAILNSEHLKILAENPCLLNQPKVFSFFLDKIWFTSVDNEHLLLHSYAKINSHQSYQLIKSLIKCKLDPNSVDINGQNFMHVLYKNQTRINLQDFLEDKTFENLLSQEDLKGALPEHFLFSNNSFDDELLNDYLESNQLDSSQAFNCLRFYIKRSRQPSFELFKRLYSLTKFSKKFGIKKNNSLLEMACAHTSQKEIVEFLLDEGFQPNQIGSKGYFPIEIAAKSEFSSVEIIETLMRRGADSENFVKGCGYLLHSLFNNEKFSLKAIIDLVQLSPDSFALLPESKDLHYGFLKRELECLTTTGMPLYFYLKTATDCKYISMMVTHSSGPIEIEEKWSMVFSMCETMVKKNRNLMHTKKSGKFLEVLNQSNYQNQKIHF